MEEQSDWRQSYQGAIREMRKKEMRDETEIERKIIW
jgi:hypothetical protein